MKNCIYEKIIWLMMCFIPFHLGAQNLEEISLKKGLTLNGSVNLNAVGYTSSGIAGRRDPFNWFLTGGLTVGLFGYSAPFSFSYSNANKSFSQPFNQFSFAPQYKWVKTYVGYNSMTFSPYTLAGHVFLGGGVELTPGKWRFSAMYGRLKKAVEIDARDTLHYANAAFKRMGYAMKAGYESNGNVVSFNVFAAQDDPASLPFVIPAMNITPQQNVAMSVAGRKSFLKKFFIDGEYGLSILNSNTHANTELSDSTTAGKNLLQRLLPDNTTNQYFDAVNASVGYQGKGYVIQLRYERIAPEYKTLGAYYFNNDMRNITIAPNVRLLKNKMALSANIGLQKNNLNQSRVSTTLRTVASVNLQYAPDERWNLTGSYSNFSSYTNMRPRMDPNFQNSLDTLNFYQVSETMSGGLSHSLGTKERPQNIMWTGSYQKASNKSAYEQGVQLSNFLSTNVSYSFSLVPSNLVLSASVNVYTNDAAGVQTAFFGPTVNVTKSFLDKTLRCSYATSYSETSSEKVKTSPVWNSMMNFAYTPRAREGSNTRNSFSVGANLLRRLKDVGQQPSFTELTGTFNYTFTF